jgi:hypothetical protein
MDDKLFIDICRVNYGAVFQMLREAIKTCPKALWDARAEGTPFWQVAAHAIWWTDFYLSETQAHFTVPELLTPDIASFKVLPDVAPARRAMLKYLRETEARCKRMLARFEKSPAMLTAANTFTWTGPTPAHRHIYNIRHAQDHAAGLNAMLTRAQSKSAPWVIAPKKPARKQAGKAL